MKQILQNDSAKLVDVQCPKNSEDNISIDSERTIVSLDIVLDVRGR